MDKVVVTINIKIFLQWVSPGIIFVAGWFLKQGYDIITKWQHSLPILALVWFSIGGLLLFLSGWIFVISQSITINELQNKVSSSTEQQTDKSIADRIVHLEKDMTQIKESAGYTQTNSKI